jgi:hypothetical protein
MKEWEGGLQPKFVTPKKRRRRRGGTHYTNSREQKRSQEVTRKRTREIAFTEARRKSAILEFAEGGPPSSKHRSIQDLILEPVEESGKFGEEGEDVYASILSSLPMATTASGFGMVASDDELIDTEESKSSGESTSLFDKGGVVSVSDF